nr:ankyrin repeat-containing protein itn1 [Quercus suber]
MEMAQIRQEGNDMIELYKAAGNGCKTTLDRLILKDPHLLNKISLTSLSETPLHISALIGHLEFSKALLLLKPQLSRELDSHRRCPLHLASAEGHTEIVQVLLEENNDVYFLNSKDHEGGNTVLHLAVMLQRIEIVKYLLSVSKVKEGADALNKMGLTASQVLNHYPKDLKCYSIQNIFMGACAVRTAKKNNLSPSLEIVVGHHDSAKRKRSSKKRWNKWLKYLRYQGDWLEETRGALMVVATVITTITFQPVINPVGGVLQPNVNDTYGWIYDLNSTCMAGNSVLACDFNHNYGFLMFMIYNTISFTASLCVVFLLISGFPLKNKVCMCLLTFAICTSLTFLAFAYLSAFSVLIPYTFFDGFAHNAALVTAGCVQLSLMVVVGMVLLIHTIRLLAWLVVKIRKFTLYIQKRQ